MSEVKIYRGERNGEDVLLCAIQFAVDDLRYQVLGEIDEYAHGYELTDLTELTFHPAGEGVWIEGVTERQIASALTDITDHRVENVIRATDFFLNILRKQFAQLSPTEEASEGSEECICPFGGAAHPRCKAHGAKTSPAKVTIELTKEERNILKVRIENDVIPAPFDIDMPNQHIGTRYLLEVSKNFIDQLKAQLTPAPMSEQEEPKPTLEDLGLTVPKLVAHNVITAILFDEYFQDIEMNRGQLRKLTEIIDSSFPTRVGGAE